MITLNRTEHPEYARERDSNAILNMDTPSFIRYKDERAKILRMDQIANEVQSMKNDMDDIKMLLQQLLDGKTNG